MGDRTLDPGADPVRTGYGLLFLLLGVVVLVLLRTAWVTEDAYISLRTVDNLVHGLGLTWNPGERVQVFTHPLWLFTLAAGYVFTHEAFYTTLAVSILCSAAAVMLLARRVAVDAWRGSLCVLLLLFSRSFVDYSTSGLENPLSHLLVVLFALTLFGEGDGPPRLRRLAFLGALAVTNRMDLLLLVGPALAWELGRQWRSAAARRAAITGFLPFPAWLAFATFYFGFPFPNTAYAKLGHGVPSLESFAQGIRYLVDSAITDPVTLLTIAAAAALAVRRRDYRLLSLLAGTVLSLLYVLKIGGDYMTGRFLSVPFLAAVLIIARVPGRTIGPRSVGAAAVGLFALTLSCEPPLLAGSDYGMNWEAIHRRWTSSSITDERKIYFQVTSLSGGNPLSKSRVRLDTPHMLYRWIDKVKTWKAQQMRLVRWGNVGAAALLAGPDVQVLDPFALCDPLLARLPALWRPRWYVGHFERTVPPGYFETLATGQNCIEDPRLAEFYRRIQLLTRSPLFNRERLATILPMNLGAFDHLIDVERYRHGPRASSTARELSTPRGDGTTWESPETTVLDDAGIWVEMGGLRREPALDISLDFNDTYRVSFHRGKELLGELVANRYRPERGGLVRRVVAVPPEAVRGGYDRLRIVPLTGDYYFGIGHVIPVATVPATTAE